MIFSARDLHFFLRLQALGGRNISSYGHYRLGITTLIEGYDGKYGEHNGLERLMYLAGSESVSRDSDSQKLPN